MLRKATKFLLVFVNVFIISCGMASRPAMDAYINSDITYEVTGTYNKAIVEDVIEDARFSNDLLYVWPASVSYGRITNERFQWGFGLAGLYEKVAIIPPEDYKELSLSNIAVTQFANVSYTQWAGHYGEGNFESGILIGLPFWERLSITTGLAYKYEFLSSESSADSAGEIDMYKVKRESIFLPAYLIFTGGHHKFAIGVEQPYQLKENYLLSMPNVGEISVKYSNKSNTLLRISYTFLK